MKNWSQIEVEKLRSLTYMSATEIAKELGRTRNSVKQKLNALGLSAAKGKPGVEKSADRSQMTYASELWNDGKTAAEIAATIGISRESLKGIMRQELEMFPKRGTPKGWSPLPKPTPETVTIQYEYREIPTPEGALFKPFFCTEVGECSWILEDFWTEPRYDSPCCARPVFDRKGKGMKRTYCQYHYEASLEKQK